MNHAEFRRATDFFNSLLDLCIKHQGDAELGDEGEARLATLRKGLEKALASPNGGGDLDD
ncbi:MAG: hypothetical protein P4L73_00955 [Caulobacteraceae bacterium]|nr:hypothetical protein [Caulobacteraceae bacterium]